VKISREFGLGESNSQQDEAFLKGKFKLEFIQPCFLLKIDAV